MTRRTPAWVETVSHLRVGEEHFIETESSRSAITHHLRNLDGKFRARSVDGGYTVTRTAVNPEAKPVDSLMAVLTVRITDATYAALRDGYNALRRKGQNTAADFIKDILDRSLAGGQ